ncbi:hypothetical protein [Microbulbifer sp. ARAS458-1]|uniref:hypothetical protein n=1 Tax=Microbulbifer sp. ARAS458-1 TaxID=3140242 RepID=UPI003877C467
MNTPNTVANTLKQAVDAYPGASAQARLDYLESAVQVAISRLQRQLQPEALLADLRGAIASTEHYVKLAGKAREPAEWAARLSGATEVLKLRLELLADNIEDRSNLKPKEPTAA